MFPWVAAPSWRTLYTLMEKPAPPPPRRQLSRQLSDLSAAAAVYCFAEDSVKPWEEDDDAEEAGSRAEPKAVQEELIADVRLIYKELDCLDSPIEVVATTEQVPVPFSATGAMYSRPAFKAVPLQHESGLISLLPREYGGQLAMVPPPGVEARLGGDDSLAIGADDWWNGLRETFTRETGSAPPSRSLFVSGALRAFVLPVDGEVNERRVLITTASAATAQTTTYGNTGGLGDDLLLKHVYAAASHPPSPARTHAPTRRPELPCPTRARCACMRAAPQADRGDDRTHDW